MRSLFVAPNLLPDEDEMILHPGVHLRQVLAVLEEAAVVVAVLTALELTFEVVIARRTLLIEAGLAAMFDDFLHPPFLGLRIRVEGLIAVAAGVVDARGDVIALGLEHVGQIELK